MHPLPHQHCGHRPPAIRAQVLHRVWPGTHGPRWVNMHRPVPAGHRWHALRPRQHQQVANGPKSVLTIEVNLIMPGDYKEKYINLLFKKGV